MSQIIDDGGVVGLTRVITLSAAGATVLDDFKYDVGNNAEFERTDNNSKTTGRKIAKGVRKGSATAQLATASVAPSSFWGQTFSTVETDGTINWVITGTGRAESKNGETKAAITFVETVGVVTVT